MTCKTCDDNGLVGDTDNPCPDCPDGERERQIAAIERELSRAGRFGACERAAAERAYVLGARVPARERS